MEKWFFFSFAFFIYDSFVLFVDRVQGASGEEAGYLQQ